MSGESGEKTEEPTAHRLKKAREKGQVAKSQELPTAAVILATTAILAVTAQYMNRYLLATFDIAFTAVRSHETIQPSGLILESAILGAKAMVPLLIVAMFAGGLAKFLQIGPLLAPKAIEPNWERLNFVKGIKNLFTKRQVVELVKSMVKITIVAWVAWITIRDGLRDIVLLAWSPTVQGTFVLLGKLGLKMMLKVGGAIAALSVLDMLYQRWQHIQDQKMTKHEVKQEYKEQEGDPYMKHARKRAHQEAVEHAAVESVRKSDVLVVNPTHYAIALFYDQDGEGAPEVVARGQDHLAKRMIEAAREEGIPIMRDIPLAHTLYELEEGTEIPEELYEAVAAILHAAWEERKAEDPTWKKPGSSEESESEEQSAQGQAEQDKEEQGKEEQTDEDEGENEKPEPKRR